MSYFPKYLGTVDGRESLLSLFKYSHMAAWIQPLPGKSYSLPSCGITVVYEIERMKKRTSSALTELMDTVLIYNNSTLHTISIYECDLTAI
ncbi:unnamed protein product, partial [Schistosoma margrebowiei]|uniref:Uncharacterized protein n=1 Tax=Schistosoma margrebowiei TaxID=48269 RepID=A0AA85A064_9TREM